MNGFSVSSLAWAGLASLGILTLTPAQRLAAQLCRPPASSHEAKTLAIFSVPLAFGPALAPEDNQRLTVGLEGASLPRVGRATATPTICQPGKGPENTDLVFAVPRPRIGMSLPLGVSLQASWIPPIRVDRVKANLFGISLGQSFGFASVAAALRAHGTFGSLRAPITCPRAALADPTSECFHGTISNDRLSPNIAGVDLSLGTSILSRRRGRPG